MMPQSRRRRRSQSTEDLHSEKRARLARLTQEQQYVSRMYNAATERDYNFPHPSEARGYVPAQPTYNTSWEGRYNVTSGYALEVSGSFGQSRLVENPVVDRRYVNNEMGLNSYRPDRGINPNEDVPRSSYYRVSDYNRPDSRQVYENQLYGRSQRTRRSNSYCDTKYRRRRGSSESSPRNRRRHDSRSRRRRNRRSSSSQSSRRAKRRIDKHSETEHSWASSRREEGKHRQRRYSSDSSSYSSRSSWVSTSDEFLLLLWNAK